MKGFGLDESMSNLTSTISNETRISSSNNAKYASSFVTRNNNDNDNDNDTTMLYAQQASSSSFGSQPQQSQTPAKKNRSLPGNPDPDAEVIALSPKSLLATNRFICEICNKGFQRDQNLQLHRRGHNLPWKLKQRANKDVIIKKVYVCPEQTCVHHDPSRALGDLTGIKKHFCRKHGEKKWNCDKCSKKYAVQSDWKAHSKICGTREYRCDCGTLFSRRDSFITHRAFCDALAQESAISINPQSTTTLSSLTHHQAAIMLGISRTPTSHISLPPHNFTSHHHTLLQSFPLKREQEDQHASNMDSIMRQDQDLPLWLACPSPPSQQPQSSAHDHSHHSGSGLPITSPAQANHQAQLSTFQAQYNNPSQNQNHHHHHHQDNNAPTLNAGPTLSSFQLALPSHPHTSATALLQWAAQMGVTISNLQEYHNQQQQQQQQQQYHNGHITNDSNSQMADELPSSSAVSRGDAHHYQALVPSSSSMLLHDNVSNMMIDNSFQSTPASSMSHSSNFGEFHHQTMPQTKSTLDGGGAGGNGGGGGNEGMTRDFLGLRTFSHKDFLNMAALGQMKSTSSTTLHQQQQNQQNQTPW